MAKSKETPWLGVEVVDVRLGEGEGNLKAFADVRFEVAGDADCEGFMVVRGFCVLHGKNGVFVNSPRKATKDGRWFDILELDERVKKDVEQKVLEAYKKESGV